MDEIRFRYIAPVPRFRDCEFVHTGSHGVATYTVTLRNYADPIRELAVSLTDESRASLARALAEEPFGRYTSVYLAVETAQPYEQRLRISANTKESGSVFQAALTALRLHSSAGINYSRAFVLRTMDKIPPGQLAFSSVTSSLISDCPFSHFGIDDSALPEQEMEGCRSTLESYLAKDWGRRTYGLYQILLLAINYHRTCFTLSDTPHSFLILVVIFESLFKNWILKNNEASKSLKI